MTGDAPFGDDELAFIEDFGVFFDVAGQPRMAGRILGALLIAEPPEMSSADLAGVLAASSGSISTMTRHLIQLGLVERVGIAGERRDFFRAVPERIDAILRERLGITRQMHRLIERGLEVTKDRGPDVRRRLDELHAFYEFFERELGAVLDRWEDRPRASRPTRGGP